MGDAACSFDPFVKVAQVDDFKAAFVHLIKEPLPQLPGGGGQSVLNAELAMLSRPGVFSFFPSVWGLISKIRHVPIGWNALTLAILTIF
jgi:hypothetical protein